jgi:hypothetical protein
LPSCYPIQLSRNRLPSKGRLVCQTPSSVSSEIFPISGEPISLAADYVVMFSKEPTRLFQRGADSKLGVFRCQPLAAGNVCNRPSALRIPLVSESRSRFRVNVGNASNLALPVLIPVRQTCLATRLTLWLLPDFQRSRLLQGPSITEPPRCLFQHRFCSLQSP